LSQLSRAVDVLKARPGLKLNAREIATILVEEYPECYAEKRQNPRFSSDTDMLSQIAAEISSRRPSFSLKDPNIMVRRKPLPMRFWYEADSDGCEEPGQTPQQEKEVKKSLTEHDLYPILGEYLASDRCLFSKRIDEKTSSNTRGSGANHWLHPDVVSLEVLDREWHPSLKDVVKGSGDSTVRLWSFEVKKFLSSGNVRESFFQAVSNSAWANYGYLVAQGYSTTVEEELRMLCGLHGIGVIILDIKTPADSEVFIQAKERNKVDWPTVNRIVMENKDFKKYIGYVETYLSAGHLYNEVWDSHPPIK
jgi:hypothetical protein